MTAIKKLLSVNADTKTKKGTKLGVLTGILYLAPHTLSGYQVCPKATAGCKAACLYTAGMGVYKNVQASRIERTKLFFEQRDTFMATLVDDIERLIRKANKESMIPAVRLNGTSDIAWEKIACVREGVRYKSLMLAFPEINFYDYTAVPGRKTAMTLPNYALTFSLKENNDKHALAVLAEGMNVSVVFRVKRSKPLPTTWNGYPVVDGDVTDVRFKDKAGVIIGLRMKGRAIYDKTGFVRPVDSKLGNA